MNKVQKYIDLLEVEDKVTSELSMIERGGYSHLSNAKVISKRTSLEKRLKHIVARQDKLALTMSKKEKEKLFELTEIEID